MKLLINAASTFQSGGVQVAKSFIDECRYYTEHSFVVILSKTLSKYLDKSQFGNNFKFYEIPYRPATRLFSITKATSEYHRKVELENKPDVVFTTSGPSYWKPSAPHLMGYNLGHFLYPDSPYWKKISYKRRLYWWFKGFVIKYYIGRDADCYVVQTDDIRNRLKKWLNNKKSVDTVMNTYSSHYCCINTDTKISVKLNIGNNDTYKLLVMSGVHDHKNLEIINEIVKIIPEEINIKWVTTLPEESLKKYFSKETLPYIYNVGILAPDECPEIYNQVDAVFLPTLLECFSATYAEAMIMKKPILTSDLGFAHTVCNDAALYFDPMNPEEILSKILKLWDNPDISQRLIELGNERVRDFPSARIRASKYIELCQNLLLNK